MASLPDGCPGSRRMQRTRTRTRAEEGECVAGSVCPTGMRRANILGWPWWVVVIPVWCPEETRATTTRLIDLFWLFLRGVVDLFCCSKYCSNGEAKDAK